MGLDGVELVLAFEEEFGVPISDAEAEAMSTVKDVVDFLERELVLCSPGELSDYAVRTLDEEFRFAFGKGYAETDPEERVYDLIGEAGQWRKWERIMGHPAGPRRPGWMRVTILLAAAGAAAAGWPGEVAEALGIGLFVAILLLFITRGFRRLTPELEAMTVEELSKRRWPPERRQGGLTREQILSRVADIVVKQLGVDRGAVTEEARFVEDLGIG